MPPPSPLAFATVAALVGLAGCSGPPVLHERSLTLAAGPDGSAEVNVLLAENETVSWRWTANATGLMFNVHSHPQGPAGPVRTWLQSVDETADEGAFTATASGTYSLLWVNVGERPIQVAYTITGAGKLDPAYPPTP